MRVVGGDRVLVWFDSMGLDWILISYAYREVNSCC